jgi:simple sugar transport system permease protein
VAPNFLTIGNAWDILQESSFVGIIALGMTLVIVAAEIDLSVGGHVALSSALLGVLFGQANWPLWAAVAACLLVGFFIGLASGLIRARWNVPSFIVTLGLMNALFGAALLITNAYPIALSSPVLDVLGGRVVFGIPSVGFVFLAAFAVFWFVSERTTFGRWVYAVGGNAEAARLSGIPVDATRMAVFAITGLMAAMVGILYSARLSSGNPTLGSSLALDVIAAVIVGGTSLFGGIGTCTGTVLGVVFIESLADGMILMGINPYAQYVAKGVIVIAVVLASELRHRSR